jgi:hypothetical protein
MVTRLRFCSALILLAAPSVSIGAGTVNFSEVVPLLEQKPGIRMFLMSSLDMDSTVTAAVRFGSHLRYLGGARMGPYIIQARPKLPENAARIEVVLCTDAQFFDASGKVTRDQFNAARLEETLTAVMLRDVKSTPAIPSCP